MNIVVRGALPDTDALARSQMQGLSFSRSEGIVPSVHVAHDRRAMLDGCVRVGEQPLDKVGLAILAAPDLGPAQKEALVAGRAVNDRRGLLRRWHKKSDAKTYSLKAARHPSTDPAPRSLFDLAERRMAAASHGSSRDRGDESGLLLLQPDFLAAWNGMPA